MVDPSSLGNANSFIIGGIGGMLIGAVVTVVVAMISGVFSLKASKAQIKVAEINQKKETTLQ